MAEENELNELIEDEEGFAGPAPARRPAPAAGTGGDGGNGQRRDGEEDAQAELARLRAENARLRAVAGLEGRRDEPVTVGDLLDALDAQTGLLREQVEEAVSEYGEDVCDAVAARVEQRLLEPLGLAGEEDEEHERRSRSGKRKPGGDTGKPKTRRGLRRGQLYYKADGSGPFAYNGKAEPDEVPDDGIRPAY
jgi:hypothetical protein